MIMLSYRVQWSMIDIVFNHGRISLTVSLVYKQTYT